MKRNDMIKLLGDYLPDHLSVSGFHGDRYSVADYLLKKIEDTGMTPPPYKAKETRIGPCWEVEIEINVHKWEEA